MTRHAFITCISVLVAAVVNTGCKQGCPPGTRSVGSLCQRVSDASTPETESESEAGKSKDADSKDAEVKRDAEASGTGTSASAVSKADAGNPTKNAADAGTADTASASDAGAAANGCKPTAPNAADGCCPVGANANIDPDCMPTCGNGALEKGETCDPSSSCPACTSTDPCLTAKVEGDPAHCNAKCTMVPVAECTSGDKCCPSGCVNATDDDCSKSCGDGTVDKATETCEPRSQTDACPTSCDDGMACTMDIKTGSADQCNVKCTHTPITHPADGDGCCPDNANVGNDDDCQARCGDGVVSAPQETCDPKSNTPCPTQNSCVSLGCMHAEFSGSTSDCTAKCVRTTIVTKTRGDGCCPSDANANEDSDCSSKCGNQITEPGEECDIGAPKEAGDQLSTATYDQYSCDAHTCKRLHLFTPCTVDTMLNASSECGGIDRCNGQICQPNGGCNGSGACTLSNGRPGTCYGNACFPLCNNASDCPAIFTCRDNELGRACTG